MDIDYESRQPIHTPAYHTSEQSTLQTPDSLCLDPHTTLANTYDDFRVTTYNLRLTHISLILTGTLCVGVMLGHHHQSVSAASQHLRRFPSYDLRLMTSQLCFTGTHHHQQPTTNNHQQSLTQFNCSLRLVTTRLTFNRSLRLTTYDFLAGTHHHQQPPAASQH